MNARPCFGTQLLLSVAAFALGCGGTMNTGTAKRPVNNKPADGGTCPSERSLCGIGAFAICADLQSDSNHCGACDRACSPGIACQAGVCQQTVCTGTTIPFSGQPTTSASNSANTMTPLAQELLTDVNGDGRLDLVQWTLPFLDSASDQKAFRVSLGQPGGGFAAPDTYHTSADVMQVFATDVNDDGSNDLYVFAEAYDSHAVMDAYRLELWLGHPDGHLTRSDAVGMSGTTISDAMAVGDLSGDGWPDLVMDVPETNSDDPGSINVYLSDSTGALHLTGTYLMGWGSGVEAVIRDWNGDGSPDLMVLGDSVQIFYNRGDGTFDQPVDCGLAFNIGMGEDALVADFNRDGKPDLAQQYSNGRVGVMLGLGECGFSPISFYAVGGNGPLGFLRVADMNGDGVLDIVNVAPVSGPDPNGLASSVQDHLLSVLLGKGDGTFLPAGTPVSLGLDVSDVAVGEVSGDQRPDIVIQSSDGQTRTWENACQ